MRYGITSMAIQSQRRLATSTSASSIGTTSEANASRRSTPNCAVTLLISRGSRGITCRAPLAGIRLGRRSRSTPLGRGRRRPVAGNRDLRRRPPRGGRRANGHRAVRPGRPVRDDPAPEPGPRGCGALRAPHPGEAVRRALAAGHAGLVADRVRRSDPRKHRDGPQPPSSGARLRSAA
jgi:hypothetical protein